MLTRPARGLYNPAVVLKLLQARPETADMPSHLSNAARLFCALACLLVLSAAARGQQRPLLTEDVDVLEPGSLRVQVGIDFMQDAKFPTSGLTGDLTRVGVIGVHVGLSPNVEFSIEGVAQSFLSINTRGASAIPLGIP